MTIHHFNTFQAYELYKHESRFFIRNDKYKAFHAKSDLHSTIWDLLDWIRMTNFTSLTDEDCNAITRVGKSDMKLDREAVMNIICGRKINRVFYEHAYDLINHSFHKAPDSTIVLNNETNFFLYEEIIQLLKFSPLRIRSTDQQSSSSAQSEKTANG